MVRTAKRWLRLWIRYWAGLMPGKAARMLCRECITGFARAWSAMAVGGKNHQGRTRFLLAPWQQRTERSATRCLRCPEHKIGIGNHLRPKVWHKLFAVIEVNKKRAAGFSHRYRRPQRITAWRLWSQYLGP